MKLLKEAMDEIGKEEELLEELRDTLRNLKYFIPRSHKDLKDALPSIKEYSRQVIKLVKQLDKDEDEDV